MLLSTIKAIFETKREGKKYPIVLVCNVANEVEF